MNKTKVGIIGCGTIGSHLAKVIGRDFREKASLEFLCDLMPERATRIWDALGRRIPVATISILIERSDLVIEAASASISAQVARESLARNKDVLIMSVGGLLDENLPALAEKSRGRIWIPSGALAGVDALLAAHEGKIKSVRLVTTKPPRALETAPYFAEKKFPKLKKGKPVGIFKGSAREAVKNFPQNINVAAVLALAGVGPVKTQVEIWTAADFKGNQHEVAIEGDFGKISAVTQNVTAPENPKTSYLAVLSAAATLRRIFSPVRIGT